MPSPRVWPWCAPSRRGGSGVPPLEGRVIWCALSRKVWCAFPRGESGVPPLEGNFDHTFDLQEMHGAIRFAAVL